MTEPSTPFPPVTTAVPDPSASLSVTPSAGPSVTPAAPYEAPPAAAQGLQPYTAPAPPPAAARRVTSPRRRRGFRVRAAGVVLTVAGALGLGLGVAGVTLGAVRVADAPPVEPGAVLALDADTTYAVFGAQDTRAADYAVAVTGPDGAAVEVEDRAPVRSVSTNRRPAVALFTTDDAGDYTIVTLGGIGTATVVPEGTIRLLIGGAAALVTGVLSLIGGTVCLIVGRFLKGRRVTARAMAAVVTRTADVTGTVGHVVPEPPRPLQDPPRVGGDYRVYPGGQ